MAKTNFKNIDAYHAAFPEEIRKRMTSIRNLVHQLVPGATETISYQIPAFKLDKQFLLYYCAFAHHLSLSSPWSKAFLQSFEQELKNYHVSKAVIQFPHTEKLPLPFIRDIIQFRKQETEHFVPEKKKTISNPDKKEAITFAREINMYHSKQNKTDKAICELLAREITRVLPGAENKIWHAHPVWFLDGNPIVGYSKQKAGIRLMFWSGAGFGEEALNVIGKKFKDASIFYTDVSEIKKPAMKRWLKKSRTIQWDYKNLVKRKGKLERLK